MLLLIGAATFLVLKNNLKLQDITSLSTNCDPLWFIPAIIMMGTFLTLDAVNIGQALSIYDNTPGFFKLISYSMAGFFFSSITPSASGGQPAQLFFMKRDGIKVSHGTFSLILIAFSYTVSSIYPRLTKRV